MNIFYYLKNNVKEAILKKINKYEALKTLIAMSWTEFLQFRTKVPLDRLDYPILLDFLGSDDRDIRDGALLLLKKTPAGKFSYQFPIHFPKDAGEMSQNEGNLLINKAAHEGLPGLNGHFEVLLLFL